MDKPRKLIRFTKANGLAVYLAPERVLRIDELANEDTVLSEVHYSPPSRMEIGECILLSESAEAVAAKLSS